MDMSAMEKNRLSILPKALHASIKRILKQIQAEIKRVEIRLDQRAHLRTCSGPRTNVPGRWVAHVRRGRAGRAAYDRNRP